MQELMKPEITWIPYILLTIVQSQTDVVHL